jgi:hypothetical protein
MILTMNITPGDNIAQERAFTTMRGTFPPEMQQLSYMSELILPGMELKGSITDQFSTWSNLNVFVLNNNQISGKLPDQLDQYHPQLTDLNFDYNSMTGPLPDSLGRLSQLRSLQLQDNAFTGPLPISLANLTALGECFIISSFDAHVLYANEMLVSIANFTHNGFIFLSEFGCIRQSTGRHSIQLVLSVSHLAKSVSPRQRPIDRQHSGINW